MEIGFAAITDPARDRQHEVDSGGVEQLREPKIIRP
jgi:hypothetical protein